MYKNTWVSDAYEITSLLNKKQIPKENIIYITKANGVSGGYVLIWYDERGKDEKHNINE